MRPEAEVRSIKVAILAMGGEGGGVLVDWIVSAAEREGFPVQSTSVPGVAQRTGATIYYLEILPRPRDARQQPVFALMPTPGDVDLVVASELMEAARAVQRGLVTPDMTLLISSSHRVYAMPEKMAMGDGRVDSTAFLRKCEEAARQFVCTDFSSIATQANSVISASLLGAIAGSGALPLSRERFETAIREGGVGVASSLKAFDLGFQAVQSSATRGPQASMAAAAAPSPASPAPDPRLQPLRTRIQREFPEPLHEILHAAIARTADYQSLDYAAQYLDRLEPVLQVDRQQPAQGWTLSLEVARHLALWMTYEDTVRVAELKARKSRFDRVHQSMKPGKDTLVLINEYFHPRVEELADTLPAGIGAWLLRTAWIRAFLGRFMREGRVVRTSTLRGFLLLYFISSLKPLRPGSLRFARETRGMTEWLDRVCALAPRDYALACEVARCQTLIKGYGDTHERGSRSFRTIMDIVPALRGADAAAQVARLRQAALADESGHALDLEVEALPAASRSHQTSAATA